MGTLIHSLAMRLGKKYRTMSIQAVISLSFTAVAAVGILFLGMSLFWRFSSTTNQMQEENSQRILAQVNLNLDSYLRRMMRISDTVYYQVVKNTDIDDESIADGLKLLYEENRDSLVSIALFDSHGGLVSSVPLNNLKQDAAPASEPWFWNATASIENLHFFTPQVQDIFDDPSYTYHWVVSLSRHVELTHDGATDNGVLLVDMNFSGIEQICRDAELSNGGYVYLVDGDGEIIYHPRQQLIYADLVEENNVVAASYRDGSHQEKFQDTARQVTVKTVGYTGWKLVGVVPTAGLVYNSYQMILFGVSLFLFSIFLMAYLNFRISQHISEPILELERAVKALEAGQEVDFEEGGCYEVRRLGHSIRSMVSTMRHLMEDIIQQEGDKRRTELEVLQSQINPHFLYNTLDSVIWMTEAGRYEEAIQMVSSLARLFRISLSKGNSIIPLRDELEHANHYMIIQKMRYKNKFEIKFTSEVDDEALYTMKLVIQPILENAIYHGMAEQDDDGVIHVRTYLDGEDIIVDVIDNGLGMRPEVVAQLLDEGTPAVARTRGSGIGVRNVHRRIKLAFGEQYGLSIYSEPDEGTTVRIRLPSLDQTATELGKGTTQ